MGGTATEPHQAGHRANRPSFTVSLIPHTADHTTLGGIAAGRNLNLEIDVLARHLKPMSEARAQKPFLSQLGCRNLAVS